MDPLSLSSLHRTVGLLLPLLAVLLGFGGCSSTPEASLDHFIGAYSGRSRFMRESARFRADGTVEVEWRYLWPERPCSGQIPPEDLEKNLHRLRLTGTWHMARGLVRTRLTATEATGHYERMAGGRYTASWRFDEASASMWDPVPIGGSFVGRTEDHQQRSRRPFAEFFRD